MQLLNAGSLPKSINCAAGFTQLGILFVERWNTTPQITEQGFQLRQVIHVIDPPNCASTSGRRPDKADVTRLRMSPGTRAVKRRSRSRAAGGKPPEIETGPKGGAVVRITRQMTAQYRTTDSQTATTDSAVE